MLLWSYVRRQTFSSVFAATATATPSSETLRPVKRFVQLVMNRDSSSNAVQTPPPQDSAVNGGGDPGIPPASDAAAGAGAGAGTATTAAAAATPTPTPTPTPTAFEPFFFAQMADCQLGGSWKQTGLVNARVCAHA